jgi:hypothetical protein
MCISFQLGMMMAAR